MITLLCLLMCHPTINPLNFLLMTKRSAHALSPLSILKVVVAIALSVFINIHLPLFLQNWMIVNFEDVGGDLLFEYVSLTFSNSTNLSSIVN